MMKTILQVQEVILLLISSNKLLAVEVPHLAATATIHRMLLDNKFKIRMLVVICRRLRIMLRVSLKSKEEAMAHQFKQRKLIKI